MIHAYIHIRIRTIKIDNKNKEILAREILHIVTALVYWYCYIAIPPREDAIWWREGQRSFWVYWSCTSVSKGAVCHCICVCFRSRFADFQHNCQPSSLSASGCVRESRAMCLKAYTGLIGEAEKNWLKRCMRLKQDDSQNLLSVLLVSKVEPVYIFSFCCT